MNKLTQRCIFSAAAAALLAAGALFGAPIERKMPATTTTKPVSTAIISRIKLRFDDVESGLTDLLSAGQSGDAGVVAAKVSYRMVIHRLYEAAGQTKDPELRALLALEADKLTDQQPAFDALAAKFVEWQNLLAKTGNSPEEAKIKLRLLAAIKSASAFEKATEKADQDIPDAAALRTFLKDMFSPLESAVLLDNDDQPLPTAWPGSGKAVAVPEALPSIEATLVRVQQASITPELRIELQAVLPKLKDAPATPPAANAPDPYRVMLDVLGLAEQLSASTALSLDARTDLSQQLRKSLVLFKDPRTRESAMHRLADVGDIAAVLTRLEKSALDPQQKQIVGAAMHQSILKMTVPATAQAARRMLFSLDRLVVVEGDFAHDCDQTPIAIAREESKKLRTTGEGLLTALMERLQTDADSAKIDDTLKHLEQVLRNFEALAAMPSLIKRSEAFKPNPRAAVERKMILLARAIADAPDTGNAAPDEIRLMDKALAVLESAHDGIPAADADPMVIDQIAGDRYKPIVIKFNDSEAKLIVGLSLPGAQLAPLIAQAESDARLLKATQAILTLQSAGVLEHLNLWGGWQLDAPARSLLIAEMTHAIGNAYLTQTGTLPLTDANVTTRVAEDVLDHILEMDRRLKGKLPAKAASWALTFSAVCRGPSNQSILGAQADKLALVCYGLNEAGCNNENGGSDAYLNATLKKALETFAAIDVSQ